MVSSCTGIQCIQSYLGSRPAKPESNFIGNQLAKTQHQAIDEGEKQVDGSASYQSPERGGFVQY